MTKMEAHNMIDEKEEEKVRSRLLTIFESMLFTRPFQSFIQLWKTFPQHVKDTICKYLNFKDILQASLVCKAFYYELGQSVTAMNKIKFRVQADWSKDIRTILENTPRNYTFINVYSDGEKLQNYIFKCLKKIHQNM